MSPFKSRAQQRFMFARKPKLAKRFAKETPSFKRLPEKSNLNETIRRAKK